MFTQTGKIDQDGRILLPRYILDALGIAAEAEVIIEMTETAVVIKPKSIAHPITGRIANMALPVAGWDQMEREIEGGRLD